MVLLTMTPAMVQAIEKRDELRGAGASDTEHFPSEPELLEPAVGKPITHAQLIDISRYLREHEGLLKSGEAESFRLNNLLRGAGIYTPPPKPKPEQTSEYKALMARLRREEEARAYARMVSPQLPNSPPSTSIPGSKKHQGLNPEEDDEEMTFAEVQRQITLIINVLVSIIACGIGIWLVAYHWSAPSRLALSMGGSGAVGVAEVVIYAGYIRRLKEAKVKERAKVEKKTITETWVIEGDSTRIDNQSLAVGSESTQSSALEPGSARQRKAKR